MDDISFSKRRKNRGYTYLCAGSVICVSLLRAPQYSTFACCLIPVLTQVVLLVMLDNIDDIFFSKRRYFLIVSRMSISVYCIPTRDTHITRDMCLGIHISRGYTYHRDTCTHVCFCFDRPLWFVWWSDGLFRDLVFLFRSSLDWFNQEDATASTWKWYFNVSPLSESRWSFQWMLLSNIPWMAPGGMAFKKNYTNKQIKLKWTAALSINFFKILAGIKENYPYGNVCLCRIIMNACNNDNSISVTYIDLRDTKK